VVKSDTAALKPYSTYKDSGVPWLGQVPESWGIRRLRTIARTPIKNGVGESAQSFREDWPRYIRITDIAGPRMLRQSTRASLPPAIAAHALVSRGDILIAAVGATYGKSYLHDGEPAQACFAGYLVRLSPSNEASPEFLSYWTQGSTYWNQVNAHVIQSTIQNFSAARYRALWLALPTLPDQVAIARYLDHADRKVRHVIHARQQLIKLLTEQRQAIIQSAVTRGLDHNVRLKPSGISWLGDVPEHWEIRRAKQVARILRGKFTYRPRNDPSLYDGVYPFIQTGSISRVGKFITSYEQTLNERGLAVSKLFPAGTLVMTIAANIGDVAVLTFDACFPDSVVGFMPHKLMDRDYLYLVLLCMKPELLREAPVNTQGNLNVERIGAMSLPCPPISEQSAIVQYVDGATVNLDNAIDAAHREIDLLREYRTRLIADVVTGKLDVRGVNVPDDETDVLPEDVETIDGVDAADQGDDAVEADSGAEESA
jgi:type I restriction enzyme S subunit